MSLVVLNVAYPLAPIGPKAVGGAHVVRRRIGSGGTHASLVIAREGSTVQGELFPCPAPPLSIDHKCRQKSAQFLRNLIAQLTQCLPEDVVHLYGVDCFDYLPADSIVPTLVTVHVPPSWYPGELFALKRRRLLLACVSNAQREQCLCSPAGMEVVPNGAPIYDFAAC